MARTDTSLPAQARPRPRPCAYPLSQKFATNACPKDKSCYPPEKFLAERVASQGLDNTADWNNIDQQVGTLADQIVAKIC